VEGIAVLLLLKSYGYNQFLVSGVAAALLIGYVVCVYFTPALRILAVASTEDPVTLAILALDLEVVADGFEFRIGFPRFCEDLVGSVGLHNPADRG